MSRCPLCGAQRDTHACSNVPPPRVVRVDTATISGLVDRHVVLSRGAAIDVRRIDPNRRGSGW